MKLSNDFLTESNVRKIISDNGLDLLLSTSIINIKKKKDIVIVSPVGDLSEFKNFAKQLENSGINKIANFVFVYKKGLDFLCMNNLDALHIKERIPLGTSGAFFAAAYLGYLLNYNIIVVSDINAFINSKESFKKCAELAKKENKVVFPIGASDEDTNTQSIASYNVNGFAFYPHSVFENIGLHTPYFWRGGEDFEFLERLREGNVVLVNKNAYVHHRRAGFTIFHKMNEKRKFYPYVAGLMKAHLFLSLHNFYYNLIFLLWYLFYSFFADTFSDEELKETIRKVPSFSLFVPKKNGEDIFEIKKISKKAAYPSSWTLRFFHILKMILSLLLTKKARIYTDEIILKIPRWKLLVGLVKAALLIPWNFILALIALKNGREKARKFVYPVKPENAKKAIKMFANMINKDLSNIQN